MTDAHATDPAAQAPPPAELPAPEPIDWSAAVMRIAERSRPHREAQKAARQTAEGVKSCLAIRDLARSVGVEMPITEQVERVCHEGADPRVAVRALMGREMKPE